MANDNPVRGEVTIVLAGKTYVLRPSFTALVKIERILDRGIVKLMSRIADQNIGVEDIAAIYAAGISANPDNPKLSFEEIGEAIIDDGLQNHFASAAKFLSSAASAKSKKQENPPTP